MAKQYYDQKINKNTDWGGDRSTGGLQVKGSRVQEFIKEQLQNLEDADAAAVVKNPSVFGAFVEDVSPKAATTDAGSDYDMVVYDTVKNQFFAAKTVEEVTTYYRKFDKFDVYNDGTYTNCHPYEGKVYVCGADVYLYDGTKLSDLKPLATEESVRAIVSGYEPKQEEESES